MEGDFNDLFDNWADCYDETVRNQGHEYREVFERYNEILERVAQKASGITLEFGVGTGNLTEKLLNSGCHVYGIEPSKVMRSKAREKLPNLSLEDGNFLHFPTFNQPIDTIVSTYAFHHLTDNEKYEALFNFNELLPVGGKIVFADTMYEDEQAKQSIFDRVTEQGFNDLLEDLNREYYTTKEVLNVLFRSCGFRVQFEQLNRYVWLMDAIKVQVARS